MAQVLSGQPIAKRWAAGVPLVALLLLLAADMGFVATHFAYRADPMFRLGTDGGYREMFQYGKTGLIALIFAWLWWRTRAPVYAAWTLLFAFVLCDDALRIHEEHGEPIAAYFGYQPAFGLRAKDLGELTVWAACGVAFLFVLAATYMRSDPAARRASRGVAVLFGVVVFFGAFVDMVHMAVREPLLRAALLVLEDGGEMLAMSLVCCLVLRLVQRRATGLAGQDRRGYSTVTDFARFRGLSTSLPRSRAAW